MTTQFINLKRLSKDLMRINNKLLITEDIATTRALNILLKQEEKAIASDVSKEYGITQAAAKQKTTVKKATRKSKAIGFKFASARTNLIKPTQLKAGGISHLAKGRRRSKITTRVKAGTKAFLINAKAGGQVGGNNIKVPGGNKKIPVYRAPGFKRKVTTLKGSSIATMVESLEIDEKRLEKRINKDFPAEYSKQLKKAKFRGKRG
jgi:hypothetical protein